MTPVEAVIERLTKVKRAGKGYEALCPGHDDREASLAITEGNDGRCLLHCHAGCEFGDVVRAMGLEVTDLMPEREHKGPWRLEDAVRTFDYHDEAGEILFKVGRFSPKTFRPFHLENGRWVIGQGDARRVPYRLPEVLAQVSKRKWVLVVEGEKDADRLAKLGFVATCNPGGAGKWDWNWCCYFEGAFAAVLPDNDDPGRAHARAVAENLHGVAKVVKVIELLGLPDKGDTSDYLDRGVGAEELRSVILAALAWDPHRGRLDDIVISTVSQVQSERVRWIWERYLPLGKLITLEGDPGLGKSTITLDWAARITTASPMPDGARLDGPSDVLIFTSEDDIGDTVRPRLDAAGANLDRIHVVSAVKGEDGERHFELPGDVERIERVVRAYGATFVVIDPFVAFLSADLNSNSDQDMRRGLMPLKRLAYETGACILLMRHLNKTSGSAMYRGGGSIGITGQSRLGMVVAKDPDDDGRRVLAVYKSNLAPEGDSWGYRVVPADLTGVSKIRWTGPDYRNADEILNPPKRKSRALQALEGNGYDS